MKISTECKYKQEQATKFHCSYTTYTCIAKQNAISFKVIKPESSWLKLHSPSATV